MKKNTGGKGSRGKAGGNGTFLVGFFGAKERLLSGRIILSPNTTIDYLRFKWTKDCHVHKAPPP